MFSFKEVIGCCLFLVFAGCGDDAQENSAENNGGNNSVTTGSTEIRTLNIPAEVGKSRAVQIEGGFVAGFLTNMGATVTRFDEAQDVVWSVNVGGIDGFRSVTVDSKGRIIVIGQAGFGPARVVRLNGDGTLENAFVTPERVFLAEVIPLPNGNLMFNDGTLVDEDFEVISHGTGGGQRIVKTDDGYLVMKQQGLALQKLDENGSLQWTTTVDLSPANYSTIGLRELSDGSILAAVSGDTNPDHTLVAAHFDADGNLLSTHEPKFETPDRDGYLVPLQFGAGIQMTGNGDKTYVSFVANSGGLGSNVGTTITAELEPTGAVKDAFFGGGGLTFSGRKLISATGSIIATDTMKSECFGSPTVLNRPLDLSASAVPAGETAAPRTYEFEPLATATVTPFEVVSEVSCPVTDSGVGP